MTRKLALDPESLSIETFESGNADEARGTVQANDVKVPCVLSAVPPHSCPVTWDCYAAEAPPAV